MITCPSDHQIKSGRSIRLTIITVGGPDISHHFETRPLHPRWAGRSWCGTGYQLCSGSNSPLVFFSVVIQPLRQMPCEERGPSVCDPGPPAPRPDGQSLIGCCQFEFEPCVRAPPPPLDCSAFKYKPARVPGSPIGSPLGCLCWQFFAITMLL